MNAQSISEWVTEIWWPFVQSATLASFLVFTVVAVVWFFIRRKASAHLGYALFLLPLVPFIFPVQGLFPLPVSEGMPLSQLLPASTETDAVKNNGDGPLESAATFGNGLALNAGPRYGEARQGAAPATTSSLPTQDSPANGGLTRPLVLFSIWFAGVLWLALRWMLAHYRTHRMARRATPLHDARTKLLVRKAMAKVMLPGSVRVAETDAIHAPAVCGLWRPTLLLPSGFAQDLDDDSITWSLHHELAHIRRQDLVVDSLQRALRTLWWFHPTLWLLDRVVNELRECACDEAALARMPQFTRQRAANALVDVIETSRAPATGHLLVESLFSERTRLEKRIMRLIDSRRRRKHGLTPAAFLALTLTAGVGLASTQMVVNPAGPELPTSEEQDEVIEEESVVAEIREVLGEDIEEVIEVMDSDEEARAALARSLAWIADAQHEDGHWDAGSARNGMAGEFNEVGVTALAIQCMRSSQEPAHQAAATRGLAWLAAVQDDNTGLFGYQKSYGFIQSHALATRVWIQAQSQPLQGEALQVAKDALRFCYSSQNPYAGWRFHYPPAGDNDTFVTSLMLRALATARDAGLEVNRESIFNGRMLIDELYDRVSGRIGYDKRGGPPPRLVAKIEDFPSKYSEYPTAVSILAIVELEPKRLTEHTVKSMTQKAGDVVAQALPTWDPIKGTNDGYHWLYGAEAMCKLGGPRWQVWREALPEALVPNQRQNGTWPLVDAWSGKDDFAHMTCVYALALQMALEQ